MVKRKILLFVVLLFIFHPVFGQTVTSATDFLKEFKALNQELPRERIYLHTDRDWYYSEDRIWFSAYVVSGSYNLFNEYSKVLYVELINPDGDLVKREAIELSNGRGSGSIKFMDGNEAGTYRLKAYTLWAMNFGDSYIFRKDLTVMNKEGLEYKEGAEQLLDVQFLPESGKLVAGLSSRMAFKAIDANGLGVDVEGVLKSDGGGEEIPIESSHLGMGVVELTPESGANYYAEINGQRYDLPDVYEKGAVMKVDNTPNQFVIYTQAIGGELGSRPAIFAHVRGEIFAASPIEFVDGLSMLVIPKDRFPSGVVHFTLLSEQGIPMAERLSFNKNPVDQVTVTLDLPDQSPGSRAKTEAIFRVKDAEGNQVVSTASVSVFDDQILPYNAYGTDIKSRLYLETELKGFIEQPGYYFSSAEGVDEDLDLLMLTQGWRSYNMNEVLNREEIELLSLAEKGFRISGKVTSGLLSKAQKNAPIFYSIGTEQKQVEVLTTDEEGEFIISGLEVIGSEQITIKGNREGGNSNINISIDKQFNYLPKMEEFIIQKKLTEPEVQIEQEEGTENEALLLAERAEGANEDVEQFAESQMQLELDEITVTSDRISGDKPGSSDNYAAELGRNGTGRSNYVNLDEQEFLKYQSMDQILNQLPGVNIIGNSIKIRTGTISFNAPGDPIYIIDGVYTDLTTVRSLNVQDVESISVLRSAVDLAMFGANGAGGAIIIELREGSIFSDVKGLVKASVQGYQIPTDFYAPKYGVTVPRDLEKKDNRITLYWDPLLDISTEGALSQFWTNDIPSNYRVVIEGVTETGVPFSATKVFSTVE